MKGVGGLSELLSERLERATMEFAASEISEKAHGVPSMSRVPLTRSLAHSESAPHQSTAGGCFSATWGGFWVALRQDQT